jgi:hypothetical protein
MPMAKKSVALQLKRVMWMQMEYLWHTKVIGDGGWGVPSYSRSMKSPIGCVSSVFIQMMLLQQCFCQLALINIQNKLSSFLTA